MSPFPNSLLILLLAILTISVVADSEIPLTSKHFTWPDIPYQVTGDNGGGRGPQSGYNLCNSTTEGPNSMCQVCLFFEKKESAHAHVLFLEQTMFVNDLSDFCIWSSPKVNDTISESEAYEVAWCTKPGHGTRLVPEGTFSGLQFLYAKNYIAVIGYLDQSKVNLQISPTVDDGGGKFDDDFLLFNGAHAFITHRIGFPWRR